MTNYQFEMGQSHDINGISLKIWLPPDNPDSTEINSGSVLFERVSSLCLPRPYLSRVHTRILYLCHSLFFLFSSLSLSFLRRSRYCSPVKSYLVTARNMLCEATYPVAFTYRSGPVPQDDGRNRPAP